MWHILRILSRSPSLQSGSPPLCSESTVSIVVNPVDHIPICYPDLIHIEEHLPLGTLLDPPYQATGRRTDRYVYSVSNDSLITIHPLTGQFQVVSDVDYETTPDQLSCFSTISTLEWTLQCTPSWYTTPLWPAKHRLSSSSTTFQRSQSSFEGRIGVEKHSQQSSTSTSHPLSYLLLETTSSS